VGSSIYHIGIQVDRHGRQAPQGRDAPRPQRPPLHERIVGVDLQEKSHGWGSHTIEFFAVGTAIVPREGHEQDAIEAPTPVLDLS